MQHCTSVTAHGMPSHIIVNNQYVEMIDAIKIPYNALFWGYVKTHTHCESAEW
jgi:hypothetical protein